MKRILYIFAKFTAKHQPWSAFLVKRGCMTDALLLILENFPGQPIYITNVEGSFSTLDIFYKQLVYKQLY